MNQNAVQQRSGKLKMFQGDRLDPPETVRHYCKLLKSCQVIKIQPYSRRESSLSPTSLTPAVPSTSTILGFPPFSLESFLK